MKTAIAAESSTVQAKEPRKARPARENTIWVTTRTGTTATASRIPPRSETAREKIEVGSPAKGTTSQITK